MQPATPAQSIALPTDLSSSVATDPGTELAVGGADPTRFDAKEVWYPVAYIEDLDPSQPTKFTLLGQDLVLWWDQSGQTWRAFLDRCPHRLVPLSAGRIAEDGLLECPYHGWAFAGSGQCDRIPQQRPEQAAERSGRACATTFATAVRQGLLFVYPGQPENANRVPIPLLPVPIGAEAAGEADGWVCLNTFRDLPYDALTLLENVLDSSHVPFTHHGSVGNRSTAGPVDLELLEFDRQGFEGLWEAGPRQGKLGRQTTTFIAPSLMWHDLTSQQFGRTITAVYATPMRKGECRIFARFPFKFSAKLPKFLIKLTPTWYSHLGQNTILEDDQIFLHYQERYLEAQGGSAQAGKAFYLPTRADTFVSALRKWFNEYQADPFPGQSFSPPLATSVLLDRYHSHTQQCASCRGALSVIQKLRLGTTIGAAIAWLILTAIAFSVSQPTLFLTLPVSLLPLATLALWLGLGHLERQFYQGRSVPSRNLPQHKG